MQDNRQERLSQPCLQMLKTKLAGCVKTHVNAAADFY